MHCGNRIAHKGTQDYVYKETKRFVILVGDWVGFAVCHTAK
jgi:hypothetical protein